MKTKETTEETTKELTIARFEIGQIEAASFTHEAHVYVAWLYLNEYETREAITRFDDALRRLVKALGVEGKYNAMITWLFLKLLAERVRVGETWTSFRARNSDLIDERPRARAS